MKTFLLSGSLAFSILTLACSTDDEIDYHGMMKATVNGVEYTFDHVSGHAHFNLDAGCFEPYGEIWGSNENFPNYEYQGITLLIDDSMPVGTYPAYGTFFKQLDEFNRETYRQNYFNDCQEDYAMLDGTVTIASKTQYRVTGVFNFVGYRITDYNADCEGQLVSVTNGYFDMSRITPSSCAAPGD